MLETVDISIDRSVRVGKRRGSVDDSGIILTDNVEREARIEAKKNALRAVRAKGRKLNCVGGVGEAYIVGRAD